MSSNLSVDASVNAVQRRLLRDAGLSTNLDVCSDKLSESLVRARIACLDGMEAYFGVLHSATCIGARNEGAAISLLQQQLQSRTGTRVLRRSSDPCKHIRSYLHIA